LWKLGFACRRGEKGLAKKVRIINFSQVFKYIQRLFLTNDLFDKSAVFFLRKLLYNFMKHEIYQNFQIEGLPIQLAACVEA